MGTRSTTKVFSEFGDGVLINLYGKWDGYASGHGRDLAKFLRGIKLVLGNTGEKNAANGMSCLAGQLIAHFKTGIGNYYIMPPFSDSETWSYTVYEKNGKIFMTVHYDEWKLFDGQPKNFRAKRIENRLTKRFEG